MEWFKDWFDSSEYLEVYKHRNDEDAARLFNLVIKNICLKPAAEVLDIACGAGRHSILFASGGYKVTAFDLSKNLLRIGREKCRELNLKVDFFNADIRRPALNHEFDLVINLFTSFGYFETDEENFALFKDAYDLLKKDAYFVFDYFNVYHLIKHLVPESVDSKNGKTVIQKRYIKGNRIIKEISLIKGSGSKSYTESVRLYNEDEIVCWLEIAGFKIKAVFGDYSGSQFHDESSPRVVIIVQK
ncbi:MAG: class I SAM-dependent methyltransferase [Ignavibacteriales bacterium]